MVTDNEVLEFFRGELSIPVSWRTGNKEYLEMDTILQDYAEWDEFPYAIEEYGEKFGVDISVIDMSVYYPAVKAPLFTRMFKRQRIEEETKRIRKPLTVRMFTESAKAGKWLYD